MRETDLKIDEVFFWCDSMSVLDYICNATSRYKSFVANRFAMIHDLIEVHRWHHIDGISNPADMASRRCSADDQDILKLWLNGPTFLADEKYATSSVYSTRPSGS